VVVRSFAASLCRLSHELFNTFSRKFRVGERRKKYPRPAKVLLQALALYVGRLDTAAAKHGWLGTARVYEYCLVDTDQSDLRQVVRQQLFKDKVLHLYGVRAQKCFELRPTDQAPRSRVGVWGACGGSVLNNAANFCF
jgi:hypothetical protein